MLHKDYDRKGSVAKKISGRDPQGAWRQDELIGGKPQSYSNSDSDSYSEVEDIVLVGISIFKTPIVIERQLWATSPIFEPLYSTQRYLCVSCGSDNKQRL
jgi:hypothetical protein